MISAVLVAWLGQNTVLAIASSVPPTSALQQGSASEKTSIAPLELRGVQEGEYFGVSVAAVDDVDGDGVRDLLVGANNYTTNDPFLGLGGRRREDRTAYAVLYSARTGASSFASRRIRPGSRRTLGSVSWAVRT